MQVSQGPPSAPSQQVYSPPPQGYSPPQQGYGQPSQGYGPPQQGYGPPPQGYGPPPQAYGHGAPLAGPMGGYEAPPAYTATPQAPFSYLTLFCPIVNEISGPKRVTHHIFYSVLIHISKDRVILTLPHRISNPKSLISLQPTKAFMRLS